MMTWLEPHGGNLWLLKFSEWNVDSWSSPKIIYTGDKFFVNWADFPSIFQLHGDTLTAHWLYMAGEGTYDYDIMVSISYDRGESWLPPESPYRDSTLGEHGFLSFFRMEEEKLGMVWLDGRNMNISSGDELNNLGQMSLYATTLKNGTWGPEILLDERVCECCPTSALDIENQVLVAYRDRDMNEVRNMQAVKFFNGEWSTPIVIHNDGWKIPGCPVNGPVLAGKGKSLAVAWFTAPNGNSQVNVAFSSDGGQTFENPIRVDSGNPLGRVDLIILSENDFLVSWMEWEEEDAEVKVRTVMPDRRMGDIYTIGAIDAGRGSGIPQMVLLDEWVYLAWTKTGENTDIIFKRFRAGEL